MLVKGLSVAKPVSSKSSVIRRRNRKTLNDTSLVTATVLRQTADTVDFRDKIG